MGLKSEYMSDWMKWTWSKVHEFTAHQECQKNMEKCHLDSFMFISAISNHPLLKKTSREHELITYKNRNTQKSIWLNVW